MSKRRDKNIMFNYCLEESKGIYAKKFGLEKNSDKIENLFLGSSHVECAIIPGYIKNYFNLSFKSIDLYYLSNLFEKYISSLKSLKNVYFFYSPFFYGWDVSKTKFYHYCYIFKILFSINYRHRLNLLEGLKEFYYRYKLKKVIKNTPVELLNNDNGFLKGFHYTTEKGSLQNISEIISHIKENTRESDNHKYLERICELSRDNNIKLTFVLPAFSNFYKKMMPDKDIIFREVYQCAQKYNLTVIDMYEESYDDNNFIDTDHFAMIGGGDAFSMDFANRLKNI